MPSPPSVATTWCHWPSLKPVADCSVRSAPGYTPKVTRPDVVRYTCRS